VPPSTSQPLSQPVQVADQNASASQPPMPAWGPQPTPQPPQRPYGPVHPPPTGSSSAIPKGNVIPPQPVVRGPHVPGQPASGDMSQMSYFGAPPPMSGPPRVGQPPPVGPPPMSQPGIPPQNLPPVNPGPQTMMNMGFAPSPESHAPNFAGQGPPLSSGMHPASAEMSGQFTAPPPPMSHSQMNAGMSGYNYSSQPRVMQPGQTATSAAGTPLSAPMSQPPPRKLDPDQMPSPVSDCISS